MRHSRRPLNAVNRREYSIQKALRHSILHNIAALFSVQIASYVIPLLLVPYLARVLGPSGWGRLAFAQSFSAYLALVIEFGFGLSGVREVARNRDNPERLGQLIAGVNGAKLVLALACGCVALALAPHLQIFRSAPRLAWAAFALALCQSSSMVWYFQGLERLKLVAALDFISRLIAALLIVLLVRMPGQEWRVLSLQALGALAASVVAAGLAWREVPLVVPRCWEILVTLRLGASMFLFRSAVSLYTVGNAFILGLFVSPQMVGYYAGAEKISKAILSLVQPVSGALYPRLSHLVREAPQRAARLARISFAVMGGGGAVMGLCACLGAPLLVRLILGAGYEPAVPILRILAALPMLIALSNVLGIQWMLPLGLDRAFNLIIVTAGGINLLLGTALASRFAGLGMAISVVAAEVLVTAAMLVYLILRGISPLVAEPVLPERISSDLTL